MDSCGFFIWDDDLDGGVGKSQIDKLQQVKILVAMTTRLQWLI